MDLSESSILDTLNTDIFPCFDTYNPETYTFKAVYRATSILCINRDEITVMLNTGHTSTIPVTYLEDPAKYKVLALGSASKSLPK